MTTVNTSAPKVLLIGASHTGKTTALKTLIKCGITPLIIATEYPDVLEDTPLDACHWHYIPPGNTDWDVLLDNAKKINSLSNDALQKLPGVNKEKYRQFFDVIQAANNFHCDRCDKSFGNAATWGSDRALVIDSLSGLSIIARDLVTGAKPVITQPDWGVMMENLERFLNACTSLPCWFIMTAHTEREVDEVAGTSKLMASTLGRKLPPKIPRFFSDVILCRRNGATFTWDTSTIDVDTKWRNLKLAGNMEPDFAAIVSTWKNRTKTQG